MGTDQVRGRTQRDQSLFPFMLGNFVKMKCPKTLKTLTKGTNCTNNCRSRNPARALWDRPSGYKRKGRRKASKDVKAQTAFGDSWGVVSTPCTNTEFDACLEFKTELLFQDYTFGTYFAPVYLSWCETSENRRLDRMGRLMSQSGQSGVLGIAKPHNLLPLPTLASPAGRSHLLSASCPRNWMKEETLHFKPSKLTKLKVKESIRLRLFFRILARFAWIYLYLINICGRTPWKTCINTIHEIPWKEAEHTHTQTDRATDKQRERDVYIYTHLQAWKTQTHRNLPAPGSKTSRPLRSSSWRKLPAPNNACDHTLFCRESHEERVLIKMWMKNLLVPQRPVEACGIGILCIVCILSCHPPEPKSIQVQKGMEACHSRLYPWSGPQALLVDRQSAHLCIVTMGKKTKRPSQNLSLLL